MVLRKRIEKLQVTLWVRARQISAQINESLVLSQDTAEHGRLKVLEGQLDTVRKRLAKVEYIAQSRRDRKHSAKKRTIATTPSPVIPHLAVTTP
jgi:hypothetical protein